MRCNINRRTAMRSTFLTGAYLFHGDAAGKGCGADSPNEKLNLACIGVGGRGAANIGGMASENLLALVDVDESRAASSFAKFPNVKRYTDYRKMLDAIGRELDGVEISTPDHSHFHPAYAAMQLWLHVYLEKPLAPNSMHVTYRFDQKDQGSTFTGITACPKSCPTAA